MTPWCLLRVPGRSRPRVEPVTWVAQVNNVGFGLDRVTVTTTWRNKADIETMTISGLVSMR